MDTSILVSFKSDYWMYLKFFSLLGVFTCKLVDLGGKFRENFK